MSDLNPNMIDAEADAEIGQCLLAAPYRSLFLYAGAGSGKTRSLVSALEAIRESRGPELWKRGQRVAVITYTNKAADEIKRRLNFNALIQVSTIHSFAWELLQGHTADIKTWVQHHLIEEINELERLQARGRAGSKAARDRALSIVSKRQRLASLPRASLINIRAPFWCHSEGALCDSAGGDGRALGVD